MKIISWNINGLKSCLRKGLAAFIEKENANIYCFQEIRISKRDVPLTGLFGQSGLLTIPNYESFWYPAKKNGYSGLVTVTKDRPLSNHKRFKSARIRL